MIYMHAGLHVKVTYNKSFVIIPDLHSIENDFAGLPTKKNRQNEDIVRI